MENILEIIFYSNEVIIGYSKELNNIRKERIHPSEKSLKEEADQISKQLKHLKGFKRFRVGFSPIDYYESCNSYDVPCIHCDSDNLKTRILYDEFYEVPKAWEKYYNLKVENMDNIRIFNKFISSLGINLDSKQLNKFRKAIKERKNIQMEIE